MPVSEIFAVDGDYKMFFVLSSLTCSLDGCNKSKTGHWLQQKPTDNRVDFSSIPEVGSFEDDSVQINNTHGFSINERTFRPLSLKHVKSDNTRSPSELSYNCSRKLSGAASSKVVHSFEQGAFKIETHSSSPSLTHKNQSGYHVASHSLSVPSQSEANITVTRRESTVHCTEAEEELFSMLTDNPNNGFR